MTIADALAIACAVLAAVGLALRVSRGVLDRRVARELATRPVDAASGLPNREALDWALLVMRRRAARGGLRPAVVLVRTDADPREVSEQLGEVVASGVQAFRFSDSAYVLLAAPGVDVSAASVRDGLPSTWSVIDAPHDAAGSIEQLAEWLVAIEGRRS